ncbi:hypothetical protein JCM14036_14830 [Desulfotomaculum defluvii]
MNNTLEMLIEKYGAEVIIARILEQLRLLAQSKNQEVIDVVKTLLSETGCDTEYIYTLCEYTNLATYVSDTIQITDEPWNSAKEL